MMKKFSLPHQSYTDTQCDRIEEMKTPLDFRFAIVFVSKGKSFGLVIAFSIAFQSALQRSMYVCGRKSNMGEIRPGT